MKHRNKNIVYHPCMSAGRPATKKAPQFGRKLAKLRQSKGWTQPELAERLGVTVKAVTYYEREAANPTTKTIENIASVFGITPTELMEGIQSNERKHSGPPSRLENIFNQISQLPKTRQKLVADMLEGFLEKTS